MQTAARGQQCRPIEAAIGAEGEDEAAIQEVTPLESFTHFPATEAKTELMEKEPPIDLEGAAGGEEAEAAAETETEQYRNLKQRHHLIARIQQQPHRRHNLEVEAFLVIV